MAQSFAEALSWVPVSATFSGTLGRAHEYARAQGHRTVTLEHLLLALAEDPDASVVLQTSNIDIARLMGDASTHLGHDENRFPPGLQADPGADEALVRILDYAAAAARQSRRREINGAIVLAAIVGEGRSVAATLLQAQGLTFEGAIKALQRAPAAAHPPPATPMAQPSAPPAVAADPPVAVNGVATQTNEQILASVRRRIDANRNAPKASSQPPAREAYPVPPVTAPPKPAWEEPRLPPAPAVVPVEPAPAELRPQPAAPSPEPPPSHAPPATEVQPPPARGASDTYTGEYPVPPATTSSAPPPFVEDDGLRPEAAEHYPTAPAPVTRPPREETGRRPPPLPPRQGGAMAEPSPGSPPRPRHPLGAPVAPPSTVPWPEPVRPQPAALSPPYEHPRATAPAPAPAWPPAYNEPNPLDGGIAGAPYPEPDTVPPRPISTMPVPAPRTKPAKPAASPAIETGQLAENIPRRMRVGRVETVEVRIGKSGARNLADGMQGAAPSYLHDLVVTKAMSVRLRALNGGFQIESASPETQWIDRQPGAATEDFASWRWDVTPLRRGKRQLQLVVSMRTIASDGLAADTVQPDQVFDIAVRADHARAFRRMAGWVSLMVAGGLLSKFGQNSFETVTAIWRGFQ